MRRPFSMRSTFPLGALALVFLASGCDDLPTEVRDLRPPAAPQGLYSVTGDGQVTLHWIRNTEPDFDHYFLWRGPAFQGPYEKLGRTTQTDFVDVTPQNGVTYYYAVSAVDLAGNESDLSEEVVHDTPRPEGFGLALANAAADPSGPSAYDFSTGTRRLSTDPNADFYFTVSGGVRLLVARDVDTDVQDAGYHALDQLDWAPSAGWSPTGEVEAIVGHAYYVATRDNHYAKVRVTSVSDAQIVVDWAYQIDAGNHELRARRQTNPIP